MPFRLGLRRWAQGDRPNLLVTRHRSQAEYERVARRMLGDGWRMSGWQRLGPEAAPDVIIATWVRDDGDAPGG